MVLDIELFRPDKGINLKNLKENQKKRYQDVSLIDKVADNDEKWRKCSFTGDKYKALRNLCSKEINSKLKEEVVCDQECKELSDEFSIDKITPEFLKSSSISQIKKLSSLIDGKIQENQVYATTLLKLRNEALAEIGNLLHTSVPISKYEKDNKVIFISEGVNKQKPYSHIDLMQMIAGVDTRAGTQVAGGRGYFLKGPCVLLQMALVQMAIHKWAAKGYQPIYTPFFMRKEIMGEVAQLSQFDEELYKVVGKSNDDVNTVYEDKYLIATSEQPLAALHRNQWLPESVLPIRYIGQSTCFRQEVGSHGRDTAGIFRVHQFEKIEQFVLTSPNDNKSWEMMEEMMDNCKEFYNDLGISFRVVNIVSGALNHSAAKKLDLEAWFPGSKAYRELVSCSNCLDYQARRLLVHFGKQKTNRREQQFVHMLNATACATTRVICVILETYQTDNGIKIPEILKKYFPPDYPDVIPFINEVELSQTLHN